MSIFFFYDHISCIFRVHTVAQGNQKVNKTTVKIVRLKWTQLDRTQSLVIFARHNRDTKQIIK